MKNKEIKTDHLILCEGRDEQLFLIHFLNYMKQSDESYGAFWVEDFGGITELKDELIQLRLMPHFSRLKSIVIIRDAEGNAEAAEQSIKGALRKTELPEPTRPLEITERNGLKLAYAMFPSLSSKKENGTLEDLCLRVLSKEKIECDKLPDEANKYLKDLESKYGIIHSRYHKNHLHTIMSSVDRFVTCKVGEAARDGLFNWQSEEFNEFKEMLLEIQYEERLRV